MAWQQRLLSHAAAHGCQQRAEAGAPTAAGSRFRITAALLPFAAGDVFSRLFLSAARSRIVPALRLGASPCLAARIAVLATALTGAVLPAAAQPAATGRPPPHPEIGSSALDESRQQDPMAIAIRINTRRSGLYQRQDTAGVASLYTAEATYIELMPVLQIFKGQEQIKGHLDELIDASAVRLVPTVTGAERNPDGTILVAGDYLVLSREDTETNGHFVQRLRWDDGAWRIAMHIFARPDPLTAEERYPHD